MTSTFYYAHFPSTIRRSTLRSYTVTRSAPVLEQPASSAAAIMVPDSRGLRIEQAAEKGLATDGRGSTRIKNEEVIGVHPCDSVASIEFFSVLLHVLRERMNVRRAVRPAQHPRGLFVACYTMLLRVVPEFASQLHRHVP
jgi:hypothetical protein